jgi:nucleoside phosphorylase
MESCAHHMLNIVTAHYLEATPFIDYYRLSRQQSDAGQLYYENRGIRLLITGQGRKNCLHSLKRYCAAVANNHRDWWINFGVAGSSQYPVGEMVQVEQIEARGVAEISLVTITELDMPLVLDHSVHTVETEYSKSGVYEMEAMTIAQLLEQSESLDRLLVIKLISDGPLQSAASNTKSKLKNLIKSHSDSIAAASDIILQQINQSTYTK